ncbi:hypothetical protein FB451DRAFT_1395950 [Mycena latifolia]|nr:hypothetical protein FB451DRAFT_1395950 [Mycena latifolia]
MDAKTNTEQQLRTSQHLAAKLKDRLITAEKHHEETTMALIEEVEDLKYQLSVAKGEKEDVAAKLLEKQYQFYELRKLFWEVGVQLTARENLKSNESPEAQLAEHQRFIASIGGKLEDGARRIIKQAKERNNVDDD